MNFLRKTPKKTPDNKGWKRLSLYPKSSTSKKPINKSSSQPKLDSNALNVEKKIRRITVITVIAMGIILLLLESTGVTNLFHTYNDDSLFTDSSGENQATNKGEYTSSWTGTYTIERMGYFANTPDCKNIITGEIHFELTQKSNGEVYGIATTKNDKETITYLEDPDYTVCMPYLVTSLDENGEQIPFQLKGAINNAGGLSIDYFDIHMFEFDSFTANRVDDILTSKYVETSEYSEDISTLTFSVTKDAEQ